MSDMQSLPPAKGMLVVEDLPANPTAATSAKEATAATSPQDNAFRVDYARPWDGVPEDVVKYTRKMLNNVNGGSEPKLDVDAPLDDPYARANDMKALARFSGMYGEKYGIPITTKLDGPTFEALREASEAKSVETLQKGQNGRQAEEQTAERENRGRSGRSANHNKEHTATPERRRPGVYKEGDSGPEVVKIKEQLNERMKELYANIPEKAPPPLDTKNNRYDAATKQQVLEYQSLLGLKGKDGIVGPETGPMLSMTMPAIPAAAGAQSAPASNQAAQPIPQPVASQTPVPQETPTPGVTPVPSASPTPGPTGSPLATTAAPTPTVTPSASPTVEPTASPSPTPIPTATASPLASASPSPAQSPSTATDRNQELIKETGKIVLTALNLDPKTASVKFDLSRSGEPLLHDVDAIGKPGKFLSGSLSLANGREVKFSIPYNKDPYAINDVTLDGIKLDLTAEQRRDVRQYLDR